MGYAARANLNSLWNRKRKADIVTAPATTPAPVRQDEPFVIELTPRNIWRLLCRRLKNPPQSPAPTS